MSVRRGTVLVVEDEPRLSGVLVRLLSPSYDVTVAHDGQDALWRFEEGQRFDVVLCDVNMPKIDGAALLANLARIDPAQARRVIVMTGDPDAPIASRLSSYYVLPKPFDVGGLRALVAAVVEAAQGDYFPRRQASRG